MDRRVHFRYISNGQGARMALPIYARFMKRVYADSKIGLTQAPFQAPPNFSVDLNCPTIKAERPSGWGDDDEDPLLN